MPEMFLCRSATLVISLCQWRIYTCVVLMAPPSLQTIFFLRGMRDFWPNKGLASSQVWRLVAYRESWIQPCVTFHFFGANSLADPRGARNAPLGGPNSFIFMQFSAKNLKNNSTYGSWRTPLGKILDPPLELIKK